MSFTTLYFQYFPGTLLEGVVSDEEDSTVWVSPVFLYYALNNVEFVPTQFHTHLFLQCRAQTTIRMRAVRAMTKTGTRTAASATSESGKTRQ